MFPVHRRHPASHPIGELIHIHHGDLMIRTLIIDSDRCYQPTPRKVPTIPTSI